MLPSTLVFGDSTREVDGRLNEARASARNALAYGVNQSTDKFIFLAPPPASDEEPVSSITTSLAKSKRSCDSCKQMKARFDIMGLVSFGLKKYTHTHRIARKRSTSTASHRCCAWRVAYR